MDSPSSTTTTTVPKIKPTRSTSEKRKEKMRETSRVLRSQESKIFTEMANLLPLPNSLSSQLDRGSVIRLAIAFIKVKSLINNSDHELMDMLNDDNKCSMTDASWSQALGGGRLLALSSEGDICYLTENLDLIGESIFDYCHPNDHNELRQILALRPDGELKRSFFLRIKYYTKTTTYKVMNCSGRVVLATPSDVRFQCLLGIFNKKDELIIRKSNLKLSAKFPISHFLVVIADPISLPSNMQISLDNQTFITHHTLDMKFNFVDEKISQFLGYTLDDLKDKSVYQYHHPQDDESIVQSYKTMFSKGQTQTPPYRFIAKYGGYVWVQTKGTMISEDNGNIKSQSVLCIHTCLSEIEEADQILCISQAEVSAAGLV